MEKILAPFTINIQGLEEKNYQFSFQGGSDFFAFFQEEDPLTGSFTAELELIKSATMLILEFKINAIVDLICDRTLNEYQEELKLKEKYIYKFGTGYESVSEEMEVIPFGEAQINIAQHLLDFIVINVPHKKVHPSLRDSYSVEDEYVHVETKQENKKPTGVDPRWSALEGLKNKLN